MRCWGALRHALRLMGEGIAYHVRHTEYRELVLTGVFIAGVAWAHDPSLPWLALGVYFFAGWVFCFNYQFRYDDWLRTREAARERGVDIEAPAGSWTQWLVPAAVVVPAVLTGRWDVLLMILLFFTYPLWRMKTLEAVMVGLD